MSVIGSINSRKLKPLLKSTITKPSPCSICLQLAPAPEKSVEFFSAPGKHLQISQDVRQNGFSAPGGHCHGVPQREFLFPFHFLVSHSLRTLLIFILPIDTYHPAQGNRT